jgi:predicted small secreted protein
MMRALLLIVVLAVAGCGTVAGVGDDIAAGANAVRSWF